MYVIVKVIDYQEDIIKIFHNKSDLDLYLHYTNIVDLIPSNYFPRWNCLLDIDSTRKWRISQYFYDDTDFKLRAICIPI